MLGRTPTAEEKRWMADVVAYGCIVCEIFYGEHTPAEVHHIDGSRKPGAHLNTIGLCVRHHRLSDTIREADRRWVSRHGDGRKAFVRAYMSEQELLTETRKRIEERKSQYAII